MVRTRLSEPDAVVVGAGPNGLAAALFLARQGFKVCVLEAAAEIGGSARTRPDPDHAGLVHDFGAASHPLAVASPFLRRLPLSRHGLRWRRSDVQLAHPLDDGDAVALYQGVRKTSQSLGPDAGAWQRLVGPTVRRFDDVIGDALTPLVGRPRHPLATARFGLEAMRPATRIIERFRGPSAAALFIGLAAHAIARLDAPLTAATGLLFAAAGHTRGWPIAEGGTGSITGAMASLLRELGGEVVTGHRVKTFADLPRARVALFDTSPTGAAEILGDAATPRDRRVAQRWRYGPAAYKVDFVVRGSVPWSAPAARQAATLHLGGSAEEMVEAEAAVVAGELPPRPFTLVVQPHVADPGRGVDGLTPLWTYAHVPHGCAADVTPLIEAQLERFAPGFRASVVSRQVTTPAMFEAANPNLHGGDIAGGATTPWQLVARPRLSSDPYATGVPGVWLCSASTPPGAGVHGMCGVGAARSALRTLTS